MMNSTHRLVAGSTAFVITTAVGLPIEVVGASVAGASIGASLPDDAENWLGLKHRRITHYPALQIGFFGAIALAAWIYTPPMVAVAICLACASLAFACVMHSVADAMTVHPDGIRLLWPISFRGYHLLPWHLRVKVGSHSVSEWVFFAIWSAAVLIYAYAHFSPSINA